MRDVNIAITAASYSGNKGAAAMLQSAIGQLSAKYGHRLNIRLMSVYPSEDRRQLPYDFVKVVSTKPEQLMFIAFPMAILFWLFGWIPGIKQLLLKNKILKAYKNTDVVIDMAGVSFVDSRGFVMNTYAFICAVVPMLMGVPVVKYSQALGSFKNPINRLYAKLALKKVKLICARGEETYENLASIGINKNVVRCADGAFTMEDSPHAKEITEAVIKEHDNFFGAENVTGLSVSSVVNKKCLKLGIDYISCMVELINALNKRGISVMLIANAARINSEKPRNNDLPVCRQIISRVADKDRVLYIDKEMDAEEIREYIAKCRFLIASRFHSMIGALAKGTPVLLVGWSHKYKEVLDQFELGSYAVDFSRLELNSILAEYDRLVTEEGEIREKINKNLSKVLESSRRNIEYIAEIIDKAVDNLECKYQSLSTCENNEKRKFTDISKDEIELLRNCVNRTKYKRRKYILDVNEPDKYLGPHIRCRKSYATDIEVRKNAASGGTVTAFLIWLLEHDKIDGAWVSKAVFENGELTYRTFIATTKEELMSASSSIYMEMPLLKHLDMLREINGRLAVVLTPCMMRGLNRVLENDSELAAKIVLKLGLFCSGNHDKEATLMSLRKKKIDLSGAERMYFRRNHWRGNSTVVYYDGHSADFSYTKSICAYKNAYFFEKEACMHCRDHYCNEADISFGDIWLKEMKKENIKMTCCVIRSEKADDWFRQAVADKAITDGHISNEDAVRAQKRALVFKFLAADKNAGGRKLNHRLAYTLAERNRRFSFEHQKALERIPLNIIYLYMCFIRFLLSF